jgi:Lhr-like helicase
MVEVFPPAVSDVLASFDPLIVEWFTRRFSDLLNRRFWLARIRAGHDVLISAPLDRAKHSPRF